MIKMIYIEHWFRPVSCWLWASMSNTSPGPFKGSTSHTHVLICEMYSIFLQQGLLVITVPWWWTIYHHLSIDSTLCIWNQPHYTERHRVLVVMFNIHLVVKGSTVLSLKSLFLHVFILCWDTLSPVVYDFIVIIYRSVRSMVLFSWSQSMATSICMMLKVVPVSTWTVSVGTPSSSRLPMIHLMALLVWTGKDR